MTPREWIAGTLSRYRTASTDAEARYRMLLGVVVGLPLFGLLWGAAQLWAWLVGPLPSAAAPVVVVVTLVLLYAELKIGGRGRQRGR